jgi:hypothetical protein
MLLRTDGAWVPHNHEDNETTRHRESPACLRVCLLNLMMESSDGMDPKNLSTSPLLAWWPATTRSIVASAMIVAVLSFAVFEVGWGWFQRYRFSRYMRDHPQTILLSPYQHQPTAAARFLWKLLRAVGTVLLLAVWVCALAFDCVVLGGVAAAWRYSQPYARARWTQIRAKIDSWKKPAPPESQAGAAPPAVLVPILRSRTAMTNAPAAPPSRQSSPSQNQQGGRPKRNVTFAEHSNNQIRFTQVSYDPLSTSESAPSSLSESRTPPRQQEEQRTSSHESQQQQQPPPPPKARIPNTPPLPRRRRPNQPQPLAEITANGPSTAASEQRPPSVDPGAGHAAAASPSRAVLPPRLPDSSSQSESSRKRRAGTSSSSSFSEFSPAVKRGYGRLRIPHKALAQNSIYRHSSTALANKMKRNREADRAVWELLDSVPSGGPNKKPATEAAVAESGATPEVPFQFGAGADASSSAPTTGVQVPPLQHQQTPGAFQFGLSSATAATLTGERVAAPSAATSQLGSTKSDVTGPQHAVKFRFGEDSTPVPRPNTEATSENAPALAGEVATPVFAFGSSLANGGGSTVPPIASASGPPTSVGIATGSTVASVAARQLAFQFGATPPANAPGAGQVEAPAPAAFSFEASDKSTQAPTDPVTPSLPVFPFGSTVASGTPAPSAPESGAGKSTPFPFGAANQQPVSTAPATIPASTFQLDCNFSSAPNLGSMNSGTHGTPFPFGSSGQQQDATSAPVASAAQVVPFGSTAGEAASTPALFQFGTGSVQSSTATTGAAAPAPFQFGVMQTSFQTPPGGFAPAGAPTPAVFPFGAARADALGASATTPAFQVDSRSSSANPSQPSQFGTANSFASAGGGVRPRAGAGGSRRALQRRHR